MGEVIAVLSGKGGTGKTSVCAGLAAALAEGGKSVLCVDCDVGLRNLDISLGIAHLETLSFLDVCRGDYVLAQALEHPGYPGLRFLTAPVSCGPEEIDAESFRDMLRRCRESFDYILLDAPAGIDLGFTLAARHADRVLLVTGPDPAAVRDAGQAGQKLELMGKENVRLIVNRVNKKIASAMKRTVDDVMDQTGLPLMGIVPEDPKVTLAAVHNEPLLKFSRRSPAAAAFRRIARRIRGIPTPVTI